LSKIINPNAPDEYKYETDYRKIPREYLNPRIPKGRGKIKWQPMATIPEQYEQIAQMIEDQDKIEKPLLSEEQLQSINETVTNKINKQLIADISYWKDGYIYTVQCYIKKVDEIYKTMTVIELDKQKQKQIELGYIVSVK
jgi:hypothetical protein